MSITPENILRHELIGLKVKIARCSDRKKVGLVGEIIDETQKTLVVRIDKKEKQVSKEECSFEITLPSGKIVEVEGKLLYGRPEERLKKKLPGKWDVI